MNVSDTLNLSYRIYYPDLSYKTMYVCWKKDRHGQYIARLARPLPPNWYAKLVIIEGADDAIGIIRCSNEDFSVSLIEMRDTLEEMFLDVINMAVFDYFDNCFATTKIITDKEKSEILSETLF